MKSVTMDVYSYNKTDRCQLVSGGTLVDSSNGTVYSFTKNYQVVQAESASSKLFSGSTNPAAKAKQTRIGLEIESLVGGTYYSARLDKQTVISAVDIIVTRALTISGTTFFAYKLLESAPAPVKFLGAIITLRWLSGTLNRKIGKRQEDK